MGAHVFANHTERAADHGHIRRRADYALRTGATVRLAARAATSEPDPTQRSGGDPELDDWAQSPPDQFSEPVSERSGIRLSRAFYPRHSGAQHAHVARIDLGANIAIKNMESGRADAVSDPLGFE